MKPFKWLMLSGAIVGLLGCGKQTAHEGVMESQPHEEIASTVVSQEQSAERDQADDASSEPEEAGNDGSQSTTDPTASAKLAFIVVSREFTPKRIEFLLERERLMRNGPVGSWAYAAKQRARNAVRQVKSGAIIPVGVPSPHQYEKLPTVLGTFGAPPSERCFVDRVVDDSTLEGTMQYTWRPPDEPTAYGATKPAAMEFHQVKITVTNWSTERIVANDYTWLPAVVEIISTDPLIYRAVSSEELAPYLDGQTVVGLD